ncbi:MAG: LapA family protein [Polaromonas sp.]|nr:LapA family protein [Polaromonas sp.]
MKYLIWLLKAAIFFTLFAFALNNQQNADVNFFFGTLWRTPMVLVVLVAFASGLAVGIFVMLPHWWKRRHPGSLPATHIQAPTNPNNPHDMSTAHHHGI